MFTAILILFGGIGIGLFLRQKNSTVWSRMVTGLIWLLLFLLGVEVGGNPMVMENLPKLGADALLIAGGAVLFSSLFAWGLWRWLYKGRGTGGLNPDHLSERGAEQE